MAYDAYRRFKKGECRTKLRSCVIPASAYERVLKISEKHPNQSLVSQFKILIYSVFKYAYDENIKYYPCIKRSEVKYTKETHSVKLCLNQGLISKIEEVARQSGIENSKALASIICMGIEIGYDEDNRWCPPERMTTEQKKAELDSNTTFVFDSLEK